MDFTDALDTDLICLDMDAKNKKEVIEKLSQLLFEKGYIDSKEQYIKDVYLRESEGITGIGNYIAIPHGKSKSVEKTTIAIARVKEPIEWETLDDLPVKLIFLFAVSEEHKNVEHVKLLSKLAAVLAYEDAQEKLLKAQTPEEVIEVFKTQKTHC